MKKFFLTKNFCLSCDHVWSCLTRSCEPISALVDPTTFRSSLNESKELQYDHIWKCSHIAAIVCTDQRDSPPLYRTSPGLELQSVHSLCDSGSEQYLFSAEIKLLTSLIQILFSFPFFPFTFLIQKIL